MRKILHAAALAAWLALAAAPCAFGQAWPAKLVRVVVPYPPGGTNDTLGRLIAERLGEQWKQQVVVENRPGATGNIGAELVARSAPDGYTLLVMPLDIAINPALYKKLPYDVRRDLTPITALASSGLIIASMPGSGLDSLADLVARARAQPGRLSYASCGNGTPHHLAMEMLKSRAGIDIVHVPYKGCALAQNAALAGEVPVSINAVGNVAQLIKAGRLKGMAVTSAARDRELPAVPTVGESGFPGFEVVNWFGLFGPAGLAPAVVGRIHGDLKSIFADPAFLKILHDRSLDAYLDTPEHFKRLVDQDVERFAPMVRQLGLQLD